MKAVRWLAVAAMIGVTTSPAVAAGELELSRDGTSWSPDLSEPLFDSNVRWVPGDIRSSSFFVRNLTSQQGRLSMDILDTAATELIDTGDISIDAQGAGGAWTPATQAGIHRLLSDGVVPGGATRRIDVTIAFDPASGNYSQLKSLALHFACSSSRTSTIPVRATAKATAATATIAAGSCRTPVHHRGGS